MKTYNTLLMLVTVLTQVNSSLISRFQKWAETHSINITDPFKHYHIYSNWLNNDKYINETNSLNLTYILGHNAYSGYNSDEFFNLMGFITGRVKTNLRGLIHGESDLASLPSSVDWRVKGVVNQVQDQGQCGSCWAFSTIQAVESASAIKYGILPKLSEQELVDCDTLSNGGRDHGCNGGIMDNAFTWVGKNGGVCSESSYPYISGTTKNAGSCNLKSCSNVVHTSSTSHVDVLVNSDNALMSALSQQPVAVAIEADQRTFQLYASGVFTGSCGTNLDHGVGLVGYGSMSGVDYYILRNSWGKTWGVEGYMYLGRGNDPTTGKPYNGGAGQCGVLGEASYPLVN
jgi:C1A family cysteine protease